MHLIKCGISAMAHISSLDERGLGKVLLILPFFSTIPIFLYIARFDGPISMVINPTFRTIIEAEVIISLIMEITFFGLNEFPV
uniref:Uncharacterized protein n=1 Tax=Lepeophtheirus salmonis TaxID=72036 RepID=A0A0K2T7N7_LEPSM